MLCHPFGTFFVRVCDVTALFFRVYRYGFCRRPDMAAMSIGRIIIGAFWIICMPSMVFDVILLVLGVLSRYVLYLLLF